jgi:hypothetical protein
MNGSASKRREGTDLEHHRALSLENVRDELASGRIQLAELRKRDPHEIDPEVLIRLETALEQLEEIIRSATN